MNTQPQSTTGLPFCIIAIKVLKECAPHIKKILKENYTYFFRNEYEFDSSNEWIRPKANARPVNPNFYTTTSENTNSISIDLSAIVGKNGDGKSSIVELIIRVLNNFAYACGYSFHHNDLIPVNGVHAELFYSIGKNILAIKCKGDSVEFYPNMAEKEIFSLTNPSTNINFLKKNAEVLFYTFVSNYSLYAYNSTEFIKEYNEKNECWINNIFHKNDGYQTPIVLNPFRKEGNIDINNENYLCKQRLMAMFADESIKEINKNEVAKGFAIKLEKESKLFRKTIKSYFQTTLNKKTKFLITDDLNNIVSKDLVSFFEKIKKGIQSYDFLFQKAKDILTELKDNNVISEHPTDIQELIQKYRKQWQNNENIMSAINMITDKNYNMFNYLQLQRILLIIDIFKLWEEANLLLEQTSASNIATAKTWNLPKILFDKNFSADDVETHAYHYIIYKTIDILDKYSIQYDENSSPLNPSPFLKSHYVNEYSYKIVNKFKNLLSDIIDKKSHITLKLRQVLNFLRLQNQYEYIPVETYNIPEKYQLVLLEKNYSTYTDFHSYKEKINHIIASEKDHDLENVELLPPPIFDVEIVIEKGNEPTTLSALSSGERQLLNSISSVAYHLRNIDSAAITPNTIGYKFVNLIFEEIELYFHPEFQQRYILRLIKVISEMEFIQLKGVHLCFVTHSPFILSDIPKSNVLFLEDGLPVFPMQEDTFGANIHTLLHNGFFLSNVPIGAFAQHKINSLFGKLHKGEATEEIYNDILLVSEPILKSQLLKLYRQYQGDYREEIDELKREIESLKKLLDLKR